MISSIENLSPEVARQILLEAKLNGVSVEDKDGVKVPFVKFVEDDSEPFTGGWL